MPSDERSLLRFVSLVPFLDDAALGAHLDVWNTTDSFLELCAGDAEEHALLLCNLFLALGKKAYVLLGHELPLGETAYVLTRGEGTGIRLWNAHTGKVYSRDDPISPLSSCPLTSVGCVFDDSNVWANVQLTDRLYEMDWTFRDNPKCWRPFFGPRGFAQPSKLQSVQVDSLDYRRSTDEQRSNLEREVEDRLQREFEELRGHRPTDWNRSLANTLKKLLKRFEDDASGGQALTKEEHEAQLDRVRATYHIVGFPLHQSMCETADIKPMIARLRNTNLWLSESPKIQFALSAYCHPYPNGVFSVWVYIAALHDLRSARTS
jgi:coiled-coil and C2 domain-containing protein 2A